jgi:electron transport complex protein RnfB
MINETAPDIVARIDDLLPQTQCTRCGYPGCKPYAAAIASGEAQINQCPPGGDSTILALAELLGRPVQALNPVHGMHTPPRVAWIDESRCIGCARCLAPCPVDAIVGAAKYMHTVLVERCTGCELCLPPCPVDCITLVATADRPLPVAAVAARARHYRARHAAHVARALRRADERARRLAARGAAPVPAP